MITARWLRFAGIPFLLAPIFADTSINGAWDATVRLDGPDVPFRFEIAGTQSSPQGVFFDGPLRIPSTSGTISSGKLHLRWEYYNADLDATVSNGVIEGNYRARRSPTVLRDYKFHAVRARAAKGMLGDLPSITGDWELHAADRDPKHVWTLTLRQAGFRLDGAILRLDGDTGALEGTYGNGNKVQMSHFSGARPALLEGTYEADRLDLTYSGLHESVNLTGYRPAQARKLGLPAPSDPAKFTTVKNPAAPFHFRSPNLAGKLVSDADPRFRDKVVLLNIGGSWCPNCNDDAPLMESLYRRYRSAGLEIVGLSFESGDDEYDRARLRAFIARHGITYPMLLAGKTEEVERRLPQLVNFTAFPTTLFLGRDGRVREIHDGFASVATGDAHAKLREETVEIIEKLLSEKSSPSKTE